ncbi:MAG: hypothetical protein N2037_08160 [Acidimicrobiales bacterium]|nr:hypothetical protein [Acidimicrobiales bacterium]
MTANGSNDDSSVLFEGRPVVGNLSLDDPSEPFTRRSAAYTTRRLLRRIREMLGDDPFFLPIVLRATPTGTVRRLTDETEIVIEGFPRSGNTFAFFALKHAAALAGRDIVISSHVHTPSAVKAAVRLRYPTLYVIRRPIDTIVSLLIAAPHVPFDAAIDEWLHHHEEILPYHERFVIGTFDDVTTDFGKVTAIVNERFGTDFPLFEPTEENVEAVFAAIDRNHQVLHGGTENVVPRPSALRKAEREWLLDQLAADRFATRLADAEALYQQYASLAN